MLVKKLAPAFVIAAIAAAAFGSIAAIDDQGREFGPYFGDDMPEICAAEMDKSGPSYWYDENKTGAECHHMAANMNGLDDPIVDVLILPPASPVPERDMRITRQSLEMWDAGIDVVAEALGLEWLAQGFEIRVSIGGPEYGDFSGNPEALYDPEIVVIVSNPVGGIGIGIDPVDFIGWQLPCLPVSDPGDYEQWAALPGFDAHHEYRAGRYVSGGCGDNLGGNICYSVNGAIDPTPGNSVLIDFPLYDLVSHEIGHCLTIGHVGDGAEGTWAKVPKEDIMAYDSAPVDRYKCVSTLNVLGLAGRMAEHLDVDGDGTPGTAEDLAAVAYNDPITDDGRPFVVHRPEDQFYASTSGWAWDCPQPDEGPIPGERTEYRIEPEWDPIDADDRDVETATRNWEMFRQS